MPLPADVIQALTVESLEDGRTRCAWVRGRPEHYLFHDAEWGRLPDVELPAYDPIYALYGAQGRPRRVDACVHRVRRDR